MKLHQVQQGSPEWFALRAGKLTASRAQAIATAGKGLETLAYEVLAEKYSSAEPINYSNEDMERGKELEEQARQMYELQTSNKIEIIGFAELDEYTGASPDGLIGDDGLIEIKCPNDKNHFKLIINGERGIDSSYLWQMQMQMLVTNRQYCIFLSYNPNFTNNLIPFKIVRDTEKIEKLKIGLEKGKKMLIDIQELYDSRATKRKKQI